MDLLENPFWILRATQWDDRQRIVELAADCEFQGESTECAKARTRLLNPRQRLAAEVAWLPGMKESKVRTLLHDLGLEESRDAGGGQQVLPGQAAGTNRLPSPVKLCVPDYLLGLPPMARANVLGTLLARRVDLDAGRELLNRVAFLVRTWERVDPEVVLLQVDEARRASSFPGMSAQDQVRTVLEERARWLSSICLKAVLSSGTLDLVRAMTELAARLTNEARRPASSLLVEIVDAYELEVRKDLEEGEAKIEALCSDIERLVKGQASSHQVLEERVGTLEHMLRSWDRLAQPVQVIMQSQGRSHEPSRRLALRVRSISVDLWNHGQNAILATRVNHLLREVFAEVDDVIDQLKEDGETLEKLARAEAGREQLEELLALVAESVKETEKNPRNGEEIGERLVDKARILLAKIREHGSDEIVSRAKDIVAGGLRAVAVTVGNETRNWLVAIRLLRKANEYVHDLELRQRIRKDLETAIENQRAVGQGGVGDGPVELVGRGIAFLVGIGLRIALYMVVVGILSVLASLCR